MTNHGKGMTMKMMLLLMFCALLAGCAGANYYGLSPEAIAAASKDNKAVYQCADFPVFGGGTAKVRSMVIDAGVIRNGSMSSKSCDEIGFTNDSNKKVSP